MQEIEIYNVIRQEIISNNSLMHWITFLVAILLLIGCKVIENRKTILSVFLPLVTPAWAASVLRFDFFIHRQGAYLRAFESQMQQGGVNLPLWETWKVEHTSGIFILPVADLVIFLLIVIPTAFILFSHTQQYFVEKHWKFGRLYAWTVLVITIFLLFLVPFIPSIV